MPEASLNEQLEAEPRLDGISQSRIGEQLRAMYDDLMQQPIPERFSELLAKLDQGSPPSEEEKP
nr:NepR family anti-sigma factor [Microvirga flavescens]